MQRSIVKPGSWISLRQKLLVDPIFFQETPKIHEVTNKNFTFFTAFRLPPQNKPDWWPFFGLGTMFQSFLMGYILCFEKL